ncbi:unnamed protein product [Chrysoparadoxa australica]
MIAESKAVRAGRSQGSKAAKRQSQRASAIPIAITAQKEAPDEVDDYQEDDFEDYDDNDFESDDGDDDGKVHTMEAVEPAQAKPSTRAPLSANLHKAKGTPASLRGAHAGDATPSKPADLKELRQAMQAENHQAQQHRQSKATRARARELESGEEEAGLERGAKAEAKTDFASRRIGAKGAKSRGSKAAQDQTPKESRPREAAFKLFDAKALSKSLSRADPRTQRWKDVLSSIQLVAERFTVLNMPPVGPYELYQRKLRVAGGAPRLQQTSQQTRDDDRSIEVQTEEVLCVDKEMQFSLGCDDTCLDNLMAAMQKKKRRGGRGEGKETEEEEGSLLKVKDGLQRAPMSSTSPPEAPVSLRLASFLQKASVVMEVLCEENMARRGAGPKAAPEESGRWMGVVQHAEGTELEGLLERRPVRAAQMSPCQPALLATMHSRGLADAPLLPGRDVVALWDTRDLKEGAGKVLVGEGTFKCLALGLVHSYIAMVGTAEGTVLLWDLREPASLHKRMALMNDDLSKINAEEKTGCSVPLDARHPSYSTACSSQQHHSGIVDLQVVPSGQGAGGSGASDGWEGSSFQVASLDDRLVVNIWVGTDEGVADDAGSQTYLGLGVGGRLRLMHSRSINLEPRPCTTSLRDLNTALGREKRRSSSPKRGGGSQVACKAPSCLGPGATALAFFTANPNQFLVGMTDGTTVDCGRLSSGSTPSSFSPSSSPSSWHAVTCLSHSPFVAGLFLVGTASGSLFMYKERSRRPVTRWEGFTGSSSAFTLHPPAISSVCWSPHRPAVFFVLDAAAALHSFDLLRDDSAPLHTKHCERGSASSSSSSGGIDDDGLAAELGVRAQGSGVMSLSCDKLMTGSRPSVVVVSGGEAWRMPLGGGLYDAGAAKAWQDGGEQASLEAWVESCC